MWIGTGGSTGTFAEEGKKTNIKKKKSKAMQGGHLVGGQQALIDLANGLVGGSLLDDGARQLQVVIRQQVHRMIQLLQNRMGASFLTAQDVLDAHRFATLMAIPLHRKGDNGRTRATYIGPRIVLCAQAPR